jgi:hypothetical protein
MSIHNAQGLLDIKLYHQVLKNISILVEIAKYTSEKLLIPINFDTAQY